MTFVELLDDSFDDNKNHYTPLGKVNSYSFCVDYKDLNYQVIIVGENKNKMILIALESLSEVCSIYIENGSIDRITYQNEDTNSQFTFKPNDDSCKEFFSNELYEVFDMFVQDFNSNNEDLPFIINELTNGDPIDTIKSYLAMDEVARKSYRDIKDSGLI